MSYLEASRISVKRPSVLILSDDPEFSRAVLARWQAERSAPEITLANSDVWASASAAGFDLIVLNLVPSQNPALLTSVLEGSTGKPLILVAAGQNEIAAQQAAHPHLLIVERREDWVANLILVGSEILRRLEALGRAHRAERSASESQRYATLGRYMLDMRPGVNDALTSILGNADLLLLEPGQTVANTREQIKTIHRMSLRLNEIMQRFSSLATEIQTNSEEFSPELVSNSGTAAS